MKHQPCDEDEKTSVSAVKLSSRGRPKKLDDEVQKTVITKAAWPLFLKHGYRRTTMGDVAKAARVSLRTVYHLFPNKKGLFGAVVARHRQSMVAMPGDYDALPIRDALIKIFQLELEPQADQQRSALMKMFIEESRQYPELLPILIKHGPDHSRAILCEWLSRQQSLGRIRSVNVETAASMLMDIVFGATSQKSSTDPNWPGEQNRIEYLTRCFDIVVEGLCSPDLCEGQDHLPN
ncbi:TetR/AcrR family transcriptional regulator [Cohaesibacter celericrescens]|uniref:TetR/AcrR family transcriptional regulator n=1 Tax=Cohaesibacter celericrescens TaxID=2067669 RepID=A0A2N5XNG3_9HYPH|nr:TetR/AcrR family transcriptional regulator [Cohaesibacter celericrescens]PLW76076.1 TetR/AcrR family transcriptional regulator [Cohaesibacter celericrescens]